MSGTEETDYVCAISGQTPEEAGFDEDADGLGDMPAGWTKITIQRRQYNPRWLAIQAAKNQLLEAVQAQVPAAAWAEQELVARVQIDAQFYAMEQATPVYEVDVNETIYLSDTDDILEDWNEVRKMLDLPALEPQGDEESGDDAEGVEEAAEVPNGAGAST